MLLTRPCQRAARVRVPHVPSAILVRQIRFFERRSLSKLIQSTALSGCTIGLILVNVALMMCERYPMDPELVAFLDICNLIITALCAPPPLSMSQAASRPAPPHVLC